MNNPAYSMFTTRIHDEACIIVIDRYDPDHPTMTVTNGIEYVLKEAFNTIDNSVVTIDRFIYRDSERMWAEVVVRNQRFVRFKPLDYKMRGIMEGIPFDNLQVY